MNTPNPLIPQGSLLEQKAKAKPHLRVAYIIVAIHLVFLGGLLIQGCKKEDLTAKTGQQTNDTSLPPLEQSNLYPTNAVPPTNPSQDLTASVPATNTINPSPAPALESNPPAGTRDYVVVQNDNFTVIGKKFGVSATAIARANPGVSSTQLKVGQKLVIPAAASPTMVAATTNNGSENTSVVKSGDTLSKIATTHGTTVSAIKTLNSLKTDRITAGEKLKLPAAKSASGTAAATVTNLGTPIAPPSAGTGNL
jgi:LysM repeat protein